MGNKNKKGAALSQYGIIIVLIALALVPIFFMTGSYLSKYFNDFYVILGGNSSSQSSNNSTGNSTGTSTTTGNTTPVNDQSIASGSVLAGQLGGTADVPVQRCVGSVCTIDYGDFVLNGIPANFGGFVQSSGTSGGSEKLLALIDQIAASANLPADQTNLLKELANAGHSQASSQKQVETMINGISNTNYGTWARDGYRNIENSTYFQDKYDQVMQQLNSTSGPQNKNLRDIVGVLSSEITKMNTDLTAKCTTIDTIVSGLRTGQGSSMNLDTEVYNALHPSASARTDMDSALICKSGHGQDYGIQCN